jgi:glycosyltransferase involved in cell wall biosynthesis
MKKVSGSNKENKKVKVSMICTVKNEEKNISKFIDSVIYQTKKPDELVIVDGGSKDKTFEILKNYSKRFSWIKIYQVKRANISQGRNFAIKHSKGDIIFTSDSSTIFEKKWVEKILKGFENNVDVVFGIYFVKSKNSFEKFLTSRLPKWDNINPNTFLPSNRNTAFRKIVWKKVGGFPENIKRADDSWFHLKAHKSGFKYSFLKNARVEWMYNRDLKKMLKLAFLDSKSEGFSGLWKERKIYLAEIALLVIGILAIFLGVLIDMRVLLGTLILLVLTLVFTFFLFYKKIKSIKISFLGIYIDILLYLAHLSGLIKGIVEKSIYKKEH